jgi:hypothetical protein
MSGPEEVREVSHDRVSGEMNLAGITLSPPTYRKKWRIHDD